MSDYLPIAGLALSSAHDDDVKRPSTDSELLVDQLRLDWPSIAIRIMLAGGAYPLVLALGVVLLNLLHFPREMGEIVLVAIFGSVVGSVIGFILTAVVILVTLPLLHAFLWSLKLRGNIIWLAAFYGGLVGFVAVMPFLMQVPILGDADGIESLIALSVGPGLTTILGQLGGAWGGWRIRWYRRAAGRAARSALLQTNESALKSAAGITTPTAARFQFQIRHLLWVGVWLSLLLTVIRLSGIPYAFALPLLVGWLIYQVATLRIGGFLLPRLAKRRAERQIRST